MTVRCVWVKYVARRKARKKEETTIQWKARATINRERERGRRKEGRRV
jgi:hypothetical protein